MTLCHVVFNYFVLQKSRVGSKRCVSTENARPGKWTAFERNCKCFITKMNSLIQNLVSCSACWMNIYFKMLWSMLSLLIRVISVKVFLRGWNPLLGHDPLQMNLTSCLIHLVLAFDRLDYVMIHHLESSQACKCICFCFWFSRSICPPTTSAYCFARTVWFNKKTLYLLLSGLCGVLTV